MADKQKSKRQKAEAEQKLTREQNMALKQIPPYAKDGLHYDSAPLRSYNRFINFLIGARGCGKGYGFEEWGLRNSGRKGIDK